MVRLESFTPGLLDPTASHTNMSIRDAAIYVRDLSLVDRPKASMTGPKTVQFTWSYRDVIVTGCTLVDLREAIKTTPKPVVGQPLTETQVEKTKPRWKERMENLRGSQTAIADGTYTLVGPNGEHTTVRIKGAVIGGESRRIVEYLCGADNETDFIGFAFLNFGKISIWRRFRGGAMEVTAKKVEAMIAGGTSEEAGLAYALTSGKCRSCNRTLTVPASINRGYGPECAKKVGK